MNSHNNEIAETIIVSAIFRYLCYLRYLRYFRPVRMVSSEVARP